MEIQKGADIVRSLHLCLVQNIISNICANH